MKGDFLVDVYRSSLQTEYPVRYRATTVHTCYLLELTFPKEILGQNYGIRKMLDIPNIPVPDIAIT